MQERKFAIGIVFIVTLIGFLPLIVMLFHALSGLEYEKVLELFAQKAIAESFVQSLLLSAFVAFTSTLIGTALGLLFGKTDFFASKLFVSLFIVPLLVPPYILALGWIDIIGVEGILSGWLFGFWGVAWVLICVYLPIPMVLSMLFLKQIAPNLENMAKLYTNEWGVLRFITLPLIMPAFVLSFLLLFILSFSEYSVANVLRFHSFSLESFVRFSAFYDFKSAMLLSLPMLLVAALVLLIERLYVEKNLTKMKTPQRINIIELSKNQQLFFSVLLVCFVFVVLVLPLFSLFSHVNLQSLALAFDKALSPLINSFVYSLSAAALLTLLGFLSAYVISFKFLSLWRFFDGGIVFLFTLPATVLGIGFILLYNRVWLDFIYASAFIVILAYVGKYLALAVKMSEHRLQQMPSSMLEAAKLSGASWFDTLRYILIPQSKKMLIAVFVVSFIFSFRESTLTMLLYPAGHETLSVYIITQMANGRPEIIAALSLIMVLSIVVPFFIFMRRKVV